MRPKRTGDKYWTGTRNFNHIQYESDLEDYIIDLENETKQLRKHAVSGRSEQLICPCCGSDKTYKTDAIHCNRCAVTTEI